MGDVAAFLDDVAAFALCGVLAASAAGQAMNQARFRAVLEGYRILPTRRLPLAALAVPAIGAVAGVLLVAAPTRSAGYLLCGLLFAVFALAVAAALVRGLHGIDCGCDLFAGPREIGSRLVARNASVAAMCVILAALDRAAVGGWAASAAAAAAVLCGLAAARAFGQLGAGNARSRPA